MNLRTLKDMSRRYQAHPVDRWERLELALFPVVLLAILVLLALVEP